MTEKLDRLEKRFAEIEEKLSSPEVIADMENYKTYMKEYKNLAPVVEKYREYKKAVSDAEEAEALASGEEDKEMRALAEEMLAQAKETADSALRE
ncbi:MAG: PCRF domain-containing protein, partial [Clostridia bacterium]|nr:PCRF domain-containing protein [Clostridia bacterium]